MCIFKPRCLVNSRPQDSHLCSRLSAATSSSVVASTRLVLRMCMALLFLTEITMAASFKDPSASAVPCSCPSLSTPTTLHLLMGTPHWPQPVSLTFEHRHCWDTVSPCTHHATHPCCSDSSFSTYKGTDLCFFLSHFVTFLHGSYSRFVSVRHSCSIDSVHVNQCM